MCVVLFYWSLATCITMRNLVAGDAQDLASGADIASNAIISVRLRCVDVRILQLLRVNFCLFFLRSVQSDALRDAFAEIDWSSPSAAVSFSPSTPHFAIIVASLSGLTYEVWSSCVWRDMIIEISHE